mgnify:CR=1 FL=1
MTEPDPLKNLNHLQRYLVEEYVEDYREGAMTRRGAVSREELSPFFEPS